MTQVVLVVDMLRGFCEEGHALCVGPAARRIIPDIQALLDGAVVKGAPILFLCDRHAPDDREFQMFPPHCIDGTEEAEVIPELARYPGEIIPKRRYSGFYGTVLDSRLQELKPDKIVVCGVLTNICVLHTVADARNRNYQVEVPVDCVASVDEESHHWALQHMEKILGAKLK
ncbi:MAG: cysteine hydrolase [Chloroflexi bacterium]|nr:cysteine hydrolase [Chloroflexota bacterium]